MSIRQASRTGGIVALVCILILIACAVLVIRNITAMEEFAQTRFDSILLAQEVRATSGGLTASARAYVSTGDSAYEKTYWDLVKIQGGEMPRPAEAPVAPGKTVPLNTLLEAAGFTKEELALLAESVKISNDLVFLEEEAMNAVKGLYKDALGQYSVKKEPDLELAQRLMFSKEYDATVERIMVPSFKFDRLVNERINTGYSAVLSALNYAIIALCVAVAIMTVLLILGISMLLRRIMAPVSASADFAHRVAEGNLDAPAPAFNFSADNEIGQMIASLKRMVANLKDRIHQAEEKSHEAAEQGEKAAAAMREAMTAGQKAEAGHAAILKTAANVEQVVSRLSTATEELSAQVEESAKSTETQRERVAASATGMEQMNTAVLEVSSRAGTAAEKSDTAREKAQQGDAVMHKSVEAITTVQRDTKELKEKMEALGKRADSIGAIMTVISDIADQTNLLALNAAIEAARAGDAGRGFAVVADEVRKLAEKTMTATKEVGAAISGIQTDTRQSILTVERTTGNLDSTTELVKQSGEALMEIVHEITETSAQVSSIATAAEEQSASSEQITRSLEEINKMAASTTEAMKQASLAVAELSGQSHELQKLVEELRKG